MTVNADGVIVDWGERADYGRVKGRKGKNVRGGNVATKPQPVRTGPATREKVARTVRKVPEVVVKISGGGKNMRHIKKHMDYISRHGEVALEDEQGNTHLGKPEVRDVRDAWRLGGIGIPDEGERRREAFNIVLSMPAGTDRASVTAAAREFARTEFPGHQYAFAEHDDEKHSHVHLVVKAGAFDGSRLNPRKDDLARWRETFAQHLREQGIEANATPRRARGVVQKGERQALRGIGRTRGAEASRIVKAQREAVRKEVEGEGVHVNPHSTKLKVTRQRTVKAYGDVARVLATGDAADQRLALEIVDFVKGMPPVKTRHEKAVEQATQRQAPSDGRTAGREVPRLPRDTGDAGREK